MTVVSVTTPDLPVIWWVFWLVVMAGVVFAALAWWLTRAALHEDAAPPSEVGHGHPEGSPPGHEPRHEPGRPPGSDSDGSPQ